MKKLKRILCIILIITFAVQTGILQTVFGAEYPRMPRPEKMRMDENSTAPLGYNEFDGYYFDLAWDPLKDPTPPIAGINKYVNLYLQEVTKPYRPSKPVIKKEASIADGITNMRLKDLLSGTIYYAYGKAYYTHTEDSNTYTSVESEQSNMVKFLTDIEINAYSYGQKQIKIEWDDVWNSGKRIDYKLYISESSNFTGTPPIYIRQQNIGPEGPVTVNQASGKLEYIYTVRDPGRVYYIRIAPDITEPELKKNEYSPTVAASSFILAKTTKMSVTSVGTIWKLDWSPVVTGLNSSGVEISYHIYRGKTDSSDMPQYMAAVDDTSFIVTVPFGEESTYYIIRAIVKKDGEDMYPGILIESDKITLKESEAPANPPMPEIVDKFLLNPSLPDDEENTIISYRDELGPNTATILWRAPKKANGDIDSDIVYDIWLITDPDLINSPPTGMKIASNLKMSQGNYVIGDNATDIRGYKYVLSNLTQNSTYYFKIVAKKTFLEYDDEGMLTDITYESLPAMKVVITPSSGPIDQPLVPGRPPLTIKKDLNGKNVVTETTAVIQLKNKWYEQQQPNGTWTYISPEELGVTTVAALEAGTLNNNNYRIVQYDPGVTIDVGVTPYVDGMDYENLKDLPTTWITGVSTVITEDNKDPYEDRSLNYDGQYHNVDILVRNLQPNTTYIIWVRAARVSAGLISGPSDPVVVTTNPVLPVPVEKPTVPVFNYYNASDDYIDLGWNFRQGYTYYIKYGTKDDINTASGNVTVTPDDLLFSNFFRIHDLSADTLYYFWIQAETKNSAEVTSRSEWSDSYLVKTLPPIPPNTPRGFGVKNTKNAVTKNSITYEWISEEGMTYILEIANDITYKDAKEYIVGSVSEFTVDGLRSNYRYYARLYAYDPKKDLRSEPTQSVTVRTLRSNDDYDSDQNIEDIITGEFVVKEPLTADKTWTIRITGVNADRFIEHVRGDKVLDYRLDLSNAPIGTLRLSVLISAKVFDALSALKENLIITTAYNQLTIRPNMFETAKENASLGKIGDFNYEINIGFPKDTEVPTTQNVILKAPPVSISVTARGGGSSIPVNAFNRPLKVEYPYTSPSFYTPEVTAGYVYPNGTYEWKSVQTGASFDNDRGRGMLSFETSGAGYVVVAERGNDFYDDINYHWAKASIIQVASVHPLKSISGRRFEPEKHVTVADSAKFMLDVMDISYGSDYMTQALKAGIVDLADTKRPSDNCTREKGIVMAVRIYELKSGEKAVASGWNRSQFKDIGQVNAQYLPKILFAADNNIIISRFSDTLGPKDHITRADIMVLLAKVMAFVGEID